MNDKGQSRHPSKGRSSKEAEKRFRARIEEIDRIARAYGWEIGRGHPMTSKIVMSEDNPFLNPNWRENVIPVIETGIFKKEDDNDNAD